MHWATTPSSMPTIQKGRTATKVPHLASYMAKIDIYIKSQVYIHSCILAYELLLMNFL